jgi:hypothetical protein
MDRTNHLFEVSVSSFSPNVLTLAGAFVVVGPLGRVGPSTNRSFEILIVGGSAFFQSQLNFRPRPPTNALKFFSIQSFSFCALSTLAFLTDCLAAFFPDGEFAYEPYQTCLSYRLLCWL